MKWLELHIDTTHAGLDPVTAMLSALDIDGVVIDDENDFQDFLENNRQYWDYVDEDLEKSMQGKSRVTFYLLDSETGYSQLAQVRIALQKLKEERSDCGALLLTLENGPIGVSDPTLPRIIKALKGMVTREIGRTIWQDNYHEHIIRDDNDLLLHWQYIDRNPARWSEDEYYAENAGGAP